MENNLLDSELNVQFSFSMSSQRKYQKSGLHIAAHNGQVEVIRVLIQAGADVNKEDDVRKTVLDSLKVESNFSKLVQVHNYFTKG